MVVTTNISQRRFENKISQYRISAKTISLCFSKEIRIHKPWKRLFKHSIILNSLRNLLSNHFMDSSNVFFFVVPRMLNNSPSLSIKPTKNERKVCWPSEACYYTLAARNPIKFPPAVRTRLRFCPGGTLHVNNEKKIPRRKNGETDIAETWHPVGLMYEYIYCVTLKMQHPLNIKIFSFI